MAVAVAAGTAGDAAAAGEVGGEGGEVGGLALSCPPAFLGRCPTPRTLDGWRRWVLHHDLALLPSGMRVCKRGGGPAVCGGGERWAQK